MTAHEYYLNTIGQSIDVDGAYGAQCWDLFAHFCDTMGYARVNCTTSGYAKDIANNKHTNGLLNNFTEVSLESISDGDWCIWTDCAACPNSHVAMFRVDNGNGTGIFLGQNQEGQYVSQNAFPYDGIIGVFRPDAWVTESGPSIFYNVHARDIGWLSPVGNGDQCGTTGEDRPIEAMYIDIRRIKENYPNATLSANIHLAEIGWVYYSDVQNDTLLGTIGEVRAIEAFYLSLGGVPGYHIEYQAHISYIGWSSWTRGPEVAGTTGQSRAIEAVRIRVAKN